MSHERLLRGSSHGLCAESCKYRHGINAQLDTERKAAFLSEAPGLSGTQASTFNLVQCETDHQRVISPVACREELGRKGRPSHVVLFPGCVIQDVDGVGSDFAGTAAPKENEDSFHRVSVFLFFLEGAVRDS